MSAVDDAIVEIDKELGDLAPKHEGLRDFSRLDLRPEAHQRVAESIRLYDERTTLLRNARVHLEALQRHGHPGIPIREIEEFVVANLEENTKTIQAALATFASDAATDLGLKASTEPKGT